MMNSLFLSCLNKFIHSLQNSILSDTSQGRCFVRDLLKSHEILFQFSKDVKTTLHPIFLSFPLIFGQITGAHGNLTVF